jgi:hypothetical protein
METKKGHVYNRNGNWIFRWVSLFEDGDEVHISEVPLSPEYVNGINEADSVEVYIVEDSDGNKLANLLPKSPYNLPYSTDFPELHVKNVSDGSVHEVWKYIKNQEGEIHIWCHTWYGHHILGKDCIFA